MTRLTRFQKVGEEATEVVVKIKNADKDEMATRQLICFQTAIQKMLSSRLASVWKR